MSTVTDSKPPRKADQLLGALSKKYEDKIKDRDAHSSGRTTPSGKRTPRERRLSGSRSITSGSFGDLSNVRASSSIKSDAMSPNVEGRASGRLFENRSPAIRASSSVFERTRSPGRRVSPVASPGLFEKARSPVSSPMRRISPSPSSSARLKNEDGSQDRTDTQEQNTVNNNDASEKKESSTAKHSIRNRNSIFGRSRSPSTEGRQRAILFSRETPLSKKMPRKNDSIQTDQSEISDVSQKSADFLSDDKSDGDSDSSPIKMAATLIDSMSERSYKSPDRQSLADRLAARQESKLSQDRSRYRQQDRSTDRSVEQSSATLIGDNESRSNSRRSSMSNFSLSQPIAAASPRSSLTSPLSNRTYALEKEQADSQLRKLEMENSSLKVENKSLKEKYNRAQSQIVHLETKLKTAENDIHRLQSERKKELTQSRQKNLEAEESFQESAREQQDELFRKVELFRVENESLEKELAAARRMTETALQSNDTSQVMEAYKIESSALREEIKKVKILLKQSEKNLEHEVEAQHKLNEKIRKLSDMNNILKQQLEMDSGGTVADKQVKGIESRLKITEERLFQERANRAGKLSEVEEKLLNENSNLQIEVKDLSRQMNREREKLRVSDAKLQELKEQQMNLNFLTPSAGNSRRYTPQRSGNDSKKMSAEVLKITEAIYKESGVQLSAEDDIIHYLRTREQGVMKLLNDWKNELQQLKDLERQNVGNSDRRKLLEDLQDSQQRAKESEDILNGAISKLVKEKHEAVAAMKSNEDKIEALEAELEYLRIQVKVAGGVLSLNDGVTNEENSEQVHKLQDTVHSLKVKMCQLESKIELTESELASVQVQLDAKSQSLDQAVQELENRKKERTSEESEGDRRQKKNEQLTIEIKSLNAELAATKEKNKLLTQAKHNIEMRLEESNSELDSIKAKLLNHNRSQELSDTQRVQLEHELAEKCSEVKLLKERYNSLETKHIDTREEMILTREHLDALNKQVHSLQDQLMVKSKEFEGMTSRLHSQETNYTSTEERLMNAQKEAEELRTQLSLEKLSITKLKSDNEREAADHKHESGKLNREIQVLTESVDTLRTQKSELSKDLEVAKVKLAEMQARLADVQADMSALKEKDKVLSQERDRLTEEKHEAKLQMARVDSEHKQEVQGLNRTVQELRHEIKEMHASMQAAQTNLGFENKMVASDLENARKNLAKKDQELTRLTEIVSSSKVEIEGKIVKVKELETQIEDTHFKNKQKVDELNASIKEKDHQIASFEKSLKELDDDSRTKKELEVHLRGVEHELEGKKVLEMKLRSDILAATEQRTKDKESIEKLRKSVTALEEQRANEKSDLRTALSSANEKLKKQKDAYDQEKAVLQDKFNQVNSDLKAAEATISVMNESRQTHQTATASLERKVESLKSQLQESLVTEKLAEQKANSIKEQFDEIRSRLTKSEDRNIELQSELVKTESDIKIAYEKLNYIKSEKDDLESTKSSSGLKVELLQREIDNLQIETASLREQLNEEKQMHENKTRAQSVHLKQQIESYEKEKAKQAANIEDLTNKLHKAKEQLLAASGEISKANQQSSKQDERLRESQKKLEQLQESLINQDNTQEKMNKRNLDLELELNELKNLVSRMEGNAAAHNSPDSSKIDNLTRAELNRTMTEWSLRLQALLEAERERSGERSGVSSEQTKVKIIELKGKLKHEQLMHTVTKNQLKAVEDENTRLRKSLISTPKKRNPSGKTHAELVQQAIMESEMRVAAQMGLSSTTLFGTMKANSMLQTGAYSFRPNLSDTQDTFNRTQHMDRLGLLSSIGFKPSPRDDHLKNTFDPTSLDEISTNDE